MKLAAVLVPVEVRFWLPKSGLILVPAMAAEALMSALMMVPSAIIALVTVPVSAAVIAVPETLVLSMLPASIVLVTVPVSPTVTTLLPLLVRVPVTARFPDTVPPPSLR